MLDIESPFLEDIPISLPLFTYFWFHLKAEWPFLNEPIIHSAMSFSSCI